MWCSARDLLLQRVVALKRLVGGPLAADADGEMDRLRAEAARAAALAPLRAECEQVGKLARFDALLPALVGELPEGGYQEIGAPLGLGESAAKQEGHRLRVRFRELVRAQVADTLEDDAPSAVEAELRSLLAEIS